MKKLSWLFLLTAHFLHAQYTDIINSNRPGISVSPYSVGTDVIQLEGGLFFDNSQKEFLKKPSTGQELQIRYGLLFDQLELDINSSFRKIGIGKNEFSRLGKATFGVKVMLYERKYEDKSLEIRSFRKRMAFDYNRLIPTVGIYAGYNFPFLMKKMDDPIIKKKLTQPSWKFGIFLQNNLSNRLVVVTNLIADEISKKNPLFGYNVALTFALRKDLSLFAENYGQYRKLQHPEYNLRGGLSFLFSRNLLAYIYGQNTLFQTSGTWVTGIGFSWRLDQFSKFNYSENATLL